MKRLQFLLVMVMLLGVRPLSAQTGTISGVVADSAGAPLENATISLVRLQDSTLLSFYLTDETGSYHFNKVAFGRYRVVASHLSFRQQLQTVVLSAENPSVTVPDFHLGETGVDIEGVTIVDEAPPVTLRGDTLEFNAASFKTTPNAMVEDLLKKLPGVEVQQDGTIKINGQTVNKVMVDGKEFFGTDPKIATQNLPADAIKKVQVFDQKNESEQLTGMNDGQQDMTINLTLKEDHKQGVFGQIMAAGGTQERWKGKATINAFRKNSQFSLLGNANNINERAFSFRELMSFTGAFQDMMEGGDIRAEMETDPSGFPVSRLLNAQSQGITQQGSGGIRGSRDWGKNLTTTGSYFYTRFVPNVITTADRRYFLPDSSYTSFLNQTEKFTSDNHRFTADVKYKPREKTTFRLKPAFAVYSLYNYTTSLTSNYSPDSTRGTVAVNSKSAESNAWSFTNDFRFAHGFAKKGRSLTGSLATNLQDNPGQSYLNNRLDFLVADTLYAGAAVQQQWFTAQSLHSEALKAAYTEPIGRKWLGEVSMSVGMNLSENARNTLSFNSLTQTFDIPVDSLTNAYSTDFRYTSGGLKFKRAGRKLSFSLGSAYQLAHLEGATVGGSGISKQFQRLLPNALLTYNFTKFRTLQFNYRSTMKSPSVTQLQPLTDNTNPLYLRVGNPNLGPQVDHRLFLEFESVNPGKSQFLMLNLSGTYSQGGIVDETEIDSLGVTRVRSVNQDGIWSGNAQFLLSAPIKALKSDFNFEPNYSLSRSLTRVNGLENPTLTQSFRPVLRWSFEPTDSFELSLRLETNLSQTQYVGRSGPLFIRNGIGADLIWNAPLGLDFSSGFTYSRVMTQGGQATSYPLWNASLARRFLKGQRLEVKISAFDMLKQNLGISQTASAAYTELLSYNTLTRYYLLGITWRLQPYTGKDQHGPGRMRMVIQ